MSFQRKSRRRLLDPIPPGDFASLATLVHRFVDRSPQEVRLALKSVYNREFNFPVDEPSFPQITSDGLRRPPREAADQHG